MVMPEPPDEVLGAELCAGLPPEQMDTPNMRLAIAAGLLTACELADLALRS